MMSNNKRRQDLLDIRRRDKVKYDEWAQSRTIGSKEKCGGTLTHEQAKRLLFMKHDRKLRKTLDFKQVRENMINPPPPTKDEVRAKRISIFTPTEQMKEARNKISQLNPPKPKLKPKLQYKPDITSKPK